MIGINDISTIDTYIHLRYAIIPNTRRHKDGVTTFGIDTIVRNISKQKSNLNNSIEVELTGMSGYISYSFLVGCF